MSEYICTFIGTKICYSAKQRSLLRKSFSKETYPSQDTLRNLSQMVGLSKHQVYQWFCNERRNERNKKIKLSGKGK